MTPQINSDAGLPSIVVRPEEIVSVFARSTGSLVCVANAEPAPTISWLRNGEELSNGSFASVTITETVLNGSNDRTIISILDVCPLDAQFSGNFSCQALNIYGQQTVEFQIQVFSGMFF